MASVALTGRDRGVQPQDLIDNAVEVRLAVNLTLERLHKLACRRLPALARSQTKAWIRVAPGRSPLANGFAPLGASPVVQGAHKRPPLSTRKSTARTEQLLTSTKAHHVKLQAVVSRPAIMKLSLEIR
jgi:hypothetical protein